MENPVKRASKRTAAARTATPVCVPLASPPHSGYWSNEQLQIKKKYFSLKKVFFFSVDNHFTPPPLLVNCPQKKRLFCDFP